MFLFPALSFLGAALSWCAAVQGPLHNELKLPRHPALAPNGAQVAFSHQGDIWIAEVATGEASRLTGSTAFETRPQWSPDGQWLAFLSDRHGNRDVFVLPVQGGSPQRLTWHSESESLHEWLDDGRLLIGAIRDRRYSRRDQGAWVAHTDGRTPTLLGDWAMLRPAVSPNGRWIVYERGHGDPRRRAYRGAASSELWLNDLQTGEHRALTEFRGNDLNPMWSADSRTVFFLSDRACQGNEGGRDLGLWKIGLEDKEPAMVFHPRNRSLRNAEISRNGRHIVAELDTSLVLVDTSSGLSRKLVVRGTLDNASLGQEDVTVTGGASEIAVAPDGEAIAFTSGGDIYVMRKHDKIKRAQRVTTHPAPDYGPIWVEDGKALLFISERDGNGEVYQVRAGASEAPLYQARDLQLRRLTETPGDEYAPTLSPNGKLLAWIYGAGKLVVGDPQSLQIEREICDGFEGPNFQWSPDSQWLAYSVADDDFNSDIFLARAQIPAGEADAIGVKPFNVTRHPDDDTSPCWSPDGRYLAFTSRRQMLDETDVWLLPLRKEDSEMTERERLEAEEQAKKAKEEQKKAEKEAKKTAAAEAEAAGEGSVQEPEEEKDEDAEKEEPEVEPVRIDFDAMHLRLRRLTRLEGNESALGFGEDSKTLFFNVTLGTRLTSGTQADTGFYSVDIHDPDPEEVESSPVGSFTRHEKELLYTKSGKITGREGKSKTYDFSVRFRRDLTAQREAVMEEAWRALDRLFYDENFHGHDWAASLEKWRPMALAASTPEDFEDVMNWLLGEMNASHMRFVKSSADSRPVADRNSTGVLGVLWDESHVGNGRRVKEVLAGMPADRELSRLQPQEVVMTVNGVPYQEGENWHRLMLGTVEQETFLEVQNVAGEIREVIIRPASTLSLGRALYRRNSELARTRVEEQSEGRLGYIHIQGMGTGSLLEFERDLFNAGYGKQGLLIDVRENGGGWTTDMVLAMLMVEDHARTIPRNGGEGYPQGRRIFATWDKPVVVLCNENSYSNAEIFSWSIKTLGRGPVVGKETYGAVISTGGTGLLDGSFVRLPFRGWYVNNEEMTNMEFNGCPPDYPVENLPGDFVKGLDRQLDKAIEVGLELLPQQF